jgi:hypothetical protein
MPLIRQTLFANDYFLLTHTFALSALVLGLLALLTKDEDNRDETTKQTSEYVQFMKGWGVSLGVYELIILVQLGLKNHYIVPRF